MSGGGSSSRSGGSKGKAAATPTPAVPANMTIPPFMPGNQSALAQQLAMGYGGSPASYMQSPLAQLFQPMTLPNPAAKGGAAPKPAAGGLTWADGTRRFSDSAGKSGGKDGISQLIALLRSKGR